MEFKGLFLSYFIFIDLTQMLSQLKNFEPLVVNLIIIFNAYSFDKKIFWDPEELKKSQSNEQTHWLGTVTHSVRQYWTALTTLLVWRYVPLLLSIMSFHALRPGTRKLECSFYLFFETRDLCLFEKKKEKMFSFTPSISPSCSSAPLPSDLRMPYAGMILCLSCYWLIGSMGHCKNQSVQLELYNL